jgi:hypothetical protein
MRPGTAATPVHPMFVSPGPHSDDHVLDRSGTYSQATPSPSTRALRPARTQRRVRWTLAPDQSLKSSLVPGCTGTRLTMCSWWTLPVCWPRTAIGCGCLHSTPVPLCIRTPRREARGPSFPSHATPGQNVAASLQLKGSRNWPLSTASRISRTTSYGSNADERENRSQLSTTARRSYEQCGRCSCQSLDLDRLGDSSLEPPPERSCVLVRESRCG